MIIESFENRARRKEEGGGKGVGLRREEGRVERGGGRRVFASLHHISRPIQEVSDAFQTCITFSDQ